MTRVAGGARWDVTAGFPRGVKTIVAHAARRIGCGVVKVPDVFPHRVAMTNDTVGLRGNVVRGFSG